MAIEDLWQGIFLKTPVRSHARSCGNFGKAYLDNLFSLTIPQAYCAGTIESATDEALPA